MLPLRSRYLAWMSRQLRAVLLSFVLLALAAGGLASRLALRPQFSELLPADDPAVQDLNALLARVGATTTFLVMLKSDDPRENRRFADALAPRLRAAPPGTWRFLAYRTDDARQFLERYGLLYLDLEDLVAARDALKRQIDQQKTGAVSLSDAPSRDDLAARALDKYGQKLQHQRLFPSGYFEGGDDLTTLVFVLRPAREALGGEETDAIYALVDQAVQETRAALDGAPRVQVIYTGDVPAVIQEKDALKEDLGLASVACLLLIALVLAAYFRQPLALPVVALPALLGTALSFALAYLAVGYLNSNTAFLGTIILGNGINYAIVLLGRYREERDRGLPRPDALSTALGETWRPTLVAAAGASIAYGSLMATTFRGFAQFGLVGSAGMLLCWGVTYTLVPALLLWAARVRPAAFVSAGRGAGWFGRVLESITRGASRAPGMALLACGLLTLALAWPLRELARDPFEHDFRKLRNQRALVEGPGAHMDEAFAVFGRPLNPALVAASRPEELEEARRKIIARDEHLAAQRGRTCVGDIEALSDLLPAQQAPKLAVLGELRRLLDDDALALAEPGAQEQLSSWRARLEVYFPGGVARPLGFDDLPESLASFYTEADGTRGRLMQVQLGDGVNAWDGRDLACFQDASGEHRLSDGTRITTVSTAGIFTGMIRSILRDGPRATALALGLVALLLWARFRGWGAVAVLLSLLVGVAWMLGLSALLGMRLNFLNFVAIPITFGIAAEYGVNLYERGAAAGVERLPEALRGTGGAVALCSLTTIIGYGTLLLSDNQALTSFGLLAGLGELTTLFSALLLVPALLSLRAKPR